MANTRDETIRQTTQEYLKTLDPDNPPEPDEVAGEILDQCEQAIFQINATRQTKWKVLHRLEPSQIADIILTLYTVISIAYAGKYSSQEMDVLGLYQTSGENEGIYDTSELALRKLCRKYCYSINKKEEDEVLHILKTTAERRERCDNIDLIAVNNGIFNYQTKTLEPFDPKYVFIAKSKVNYNPVAANQIIHNPEDGSDWDVETWVADLFDDPEITQLIWEILGAIIRPNVPWGKSAWFYSTTGNNGKGTLCELMRQLCGTGSYATVALSDFSKEFMLEPLVKAQSIIVDENDVGTYIDKAANLKAVITQDVIAINRKFKAPIAFRFKGFMVQCLNEMPKVKDKSDSFFRRQIFVPFTKCFTGAERKYIKNDYLHRAEVLEYVLYKVLHMDYYQLSCPKACQLALQEYKEFNDPMRQFASDILPELRWNLVPFPFLYDLYCAWYKENVGSGDTLSRQGFIQSFLTILKDFPDWDCPDKNKKYKPVNKMDWPEPLIATYHLTKWMHPMYKGSDNIDKKCLTPLLPNYRGIVRTTTNPYIDENGEPK